MKNKSLYILLVFLLMVSGTCGQGTLSITLSNNPSIIHSMLPPDINTADVTILTQNVILQANIEGKWKKSGESISATNTVTFELITLNIAGIYEFYTMESGVSTLAIQIQISVTGMNMANFTPEKEYNILSGNEVFYADTTLVCATSMTTEPRWTFKAVQTDTYLDQSSALWDPTTGISTLTITTTQQGYYTCTPIAGETTYTVAIFNLGVTVEAQDGMTYTYTEGIDPPVTQILCTTTDTFIPIGIINWGNDAPYNMNPILLSSIPNSQTLNCNTGSLEITVIVQGPPIITITHSNTMSSFSRSNTTAVEINILTQFTLQTNLQGRWNTPTDSYNSNNPLQVDTSTKDQAGLYRFYVTSTKGEEIETIQLEIKITGGNIAELTSAELYNILSGNEAYYIDTTLVCVTNGTSEPSWEYKTVQTDTYMNQQPTSWNPTTGISTLTITITKQGYYTCTPIAGESTYTVAIFNPDVTVEVTTPEIKVFTKGIDSSLLQLLCRSSDNTVPLDEIIWTSTLNSTLSISNPLRINTLSNDNHFLRCNNGSNTTINYSIIVQGPPALTITDTSSISYSMLPPVINTVNITLFSQNVMLEVNLGIQNSLGRWVTPLSPEITESSTTISEFTANLAGLYQFYVKNFQDTEELAIQIQISVTGSNFAELTSSNEYTLLSGNNIFYTNTTLVCVTSDTSVVPVWTYRETQQGSDSTPTGVIWDTSTGISRLDIVTTQQGYYTCTTSDSYSIAIFNPDITTIATDGNTYTYTSGLYSSDTQLLCTSDSNTALSDIRWGFMDNPIVLDSLQNQETLLSCRISSTATNILQINLVIQGPPVITLSTTPGTEYTNLPNSPDANTADIMILSQNVMLQANLEGRWQLPNSSSIDGKLMEIKLFTKNLAGLYEFYTAGLEDTEVLAIQIEITAIGNRFAEVTSPEVYNILSGNEVFYADTTLACATSGASEPSWEYKAVQTDNYTDKQPTLWDSTAGISTLTITTTQQGYYTCTIAGESVYNIAIFNDDSTTIASNGKKYTYTRGVSPTETQLLCTTNSNTALSNIRWGLMNNPLILDHLQDQDTTLVCSTVSPSSIVLQVGLLIQGPPEITLSTTSDTYTNLPNSPNTNTANIMVLSQDVTLQANLEGRWQLPNGSSVTGKLIEIKLFTKNLAGMYEFYTAGLEDTEVLAIQIEITAIGSNFAELSPSNEYSLLSGNNIFYTDTTLVCVTSDTSREPVWTYRETQQGSDNIPTGVIWDTSTGISRLDIVTTQQGYYTCAVSSDSYSSAIFNPDITTNAIDGQKYTYTKDIDLSDTQLLCTTTDSNTALSDIKWGSLNNPLVLNSAQNQDITTLCTVSVSTTILSVNLVIQGPPKITLSISSDTVFTHLLTVPETNSAGITVLSQNVVLQSNLKGKWERADGSSVYESMIEFELFTKELAGTYKFYVTSWDGRELMLLRIEISAIGINLAEVSQGIYNILSGNDVFLNDTTLACVTSGTSPPQWSYKAAQTNTYTTQSATSWDSTTGISTLTINTTQQGYHTCTPIAGGITYTVAIFNPDVTVEVAAQGIKAFTRDIDSPQLQLLCRSSDLSIPLDDIQWSSVLDSSLNIQNPFIVYTLNNDNHILRCDRGSDTSFGLSVYVQGPPTLMITYKSGESYTMLLPVNNIADITVFSQNVKLEVNLVTQNSLGRWKTPLSPEITDSSTTISEFTANLAGLYQFYVKNFQDTEELAIQIQISVTGSNFAELSSPNEYTLLSGNNIFYTDTTLVCVTSDTSVVPVWSYRETQQGRLIRPTGVIWDSTTRISTLTITTTQQGYYTCTISDVSYSTAIFNPDITTIATDGQEYTYTKNIDSSDILLLCIKMDTNTALSDITWGSLDNPLVLDSAENQDTTIQCSVSSSTMILSVNLIIQGPPVITLSTTPETYYTNLPNSADNNEVGIAALSQNVVLQINLEGSWELPDGSLVTGDSIHFQLFTKNLTGLYKFYVTSWNGTKVLAIKIQITAVDGIAELTSPGVYNILSCNEVFDTDTILACATSGTSEPSWEYKAVQTDTYSTVSATTWDSTAGISTLTITTTQQGYYTCTLIAGETMYTVAILNPDVTIEVTTSKVNQFTRGINSPLLQLLCRSSDTNIPLDDVQWSSVLDSQLNILNPFIVNTLNNGFHQLQCNRGSDTQISYNITIQGPPTLTITDTSSRSYTMLPPTINTADITVFSQNVMLEVNLVTQNDLGRWVTPLSPEITNSSTTISEFTANLAGLYQFYVKNFIGDEELAMQVQISVVGTAFLRITNDREDNVYQKLENNVGIDIAENVTLACATSLIAEQSMLWSYQMDSLSKPLEKSRGINTTTGLSVFEANETGGYSCRAKDHNGNVMIYSVLLIRPSEDIVTITKEEFSTVETRAFTIGEPIQYFYQNPLILISAIRWGINPGVEEDINREFSNPVSINDVFNRFGSGSIQLSCFYRESPPTIIGDIPINMRDNESLTIEYGGTLTTFNDLSNTNFPNPQNISIEVVTRMVRFSCNLDTTCEVLKDGLSSPIALEINSIRIENNGTYSLRRTTETGNSYTTAKFDLIVKGFIEQDITKLNATVINDTSINIAWDLQNILPDNAEETFNVTYQRDGSELVIAGVTQGDSFNITDLVAGVMYTVWVELSYTYTFDKPKSTIRVLIPSPIDLLIPIVIVIVVVLILLLVVIVVILIILYIWKIRGKNDKKFTTLSTDENEPKMKAPVHSSRDFEYEQIPAIDNLAYNPVLTESLPKFNQSASRDSRNYQNLPDMKDPRMKPIPLELYKKTIDKLWEDENALENEYKSLGGETLRYECSFAQIDQNRIKNKYKFIYPYDKSRVVLKKIGKDVHSDYINASNIPGMYVDENFIAAQGPKVNTIADIWRMVFELKIVNIVMVTNCVEGGKLKCEEYFAIKEGRTNEYAEYKVKTTSLTQYVGHITRVLKVQSSKESIQVKHFHFTAWPDHDVPSLHDELLQFIGYVQDNITQSETPILVHCSAGVGRTGTFITLFNLRAAILRRQPISIYHLVHEMREHRPHMVQTYRQYKFIYLAVLELLLENTSIPAEEFSSTYQNYLQSDQTGYVSVFFQQFSELNYQCEKSFEYATDIGEDNEEKNPIPNILPYDNNRVVIYSPYFECGYINASYHENNLFITTQHPTENTLLDFLQMIYQTEATLVVMLTTAKEKAKIQGNMIGRKAYWPSKDVPLEVPPFQVEVVNSEKSTSMVKQKIVLRNLKESSERVFTQAVSTSWTDKSDPTDLNAAALLIHLLLHHRQESPNSTIIMHCTDSISKTGVMFTVYQSIKEMERTGKIDMFHTVKRLRRERMKLIPNLTQFLACYSLMNEYCSSK